MKLELGSGGRGTPGYVHSDIRALAGVDVACASTLLPFADGSVDEIFARHTLEHHTRAEAAQVLRECRRVLRPGGVLRVTVPNIEAHVWQWLTGDREHSAAAFWGWQKHGRDAHKWGYDWTSLRAALAEAGFARVRNLTGEPDSREHSILHLEVEAVKGGGAARGTLTPSTTPYKAVLERMVPGTEQAARAWALHIKRYALARELLPKGRIIDVGCGVGYGADYLAADSALTVTGVDVADEAVDWARSHYDRPNLFFERADAVGLPFADAAFDAAVCFEVFEHVAEPRRLLGEIRRVLKPGGMLIVSTPNKLTFSPDHADKSSPNPYHVREYRLDEFTALLREFFTVTRLFHEKYAPPYDGHRRAVEALRWQSRHAAPLGRLWRAACKAARLFPPLAKLGRRLIGAPPDEHRPRMDTFVAPLPTADDVLMSEAASDAVDALYFVAVCRPPAAAEEQP